MYGGYSHRRGLSCSALWQLALLHVCLAVSAVLESWAAKNPNTGLTYHVLLPNTAIIAYAIGLLTGFR